MENRERVYSSCLTGCNRQIQDHNRHRWRQKKWIRMRTLELTSFWIYSHIRSFTFWVLANDLIALSISLMMPNWGAGRCPERTMAAAVTDVSEGIKGEGAEGPWGRGSVWVFQAYKSRRNCQGKLPTRRVHVVSYFLNEIPNFCATFGILKAQCIVDSIWFRPHDEGVYTLRKYMSTTLSPNVRAEEDQSGVWVGGRVQKTVKGKMGPSCQGKLQLTLLALIHVICANSCRQNDLVIVSLGTGDKKGFLSFFWKLTKAESGPPVHPSRTNEFVDLRRRVSVG